MTVITKEAIIEKKVDIFKNLDIDDNITNNNIVKKPVEIKLDQLGRLYMTGKRKASICKLRMKEGTGKIIINGKKIEDYFGRAILSVIARQSLVLLKKDDKIDIIATCLGGGLAGQSGAFLLAISKALSALYPEDHKILRQNGFLTRDSRVVERKKYGYKKARKGKTYRKR